MIITGSNLQLASNHAYLEYQRRDESLRAWKDGPDGRQELQLRSSSEQMRLSASSDWVSLSSGALLPQVEPSRDLPGSLATALADAAPASTEAVAPQADATVSSPDELKYTFLRLLVEQMTGRSVQVFDARELNAADAGSVPAEVKQAAKAQQANPNGDREGWGLSYQAKETYQETETTQFTAKGIVRTADGKEIEMDLELNMSRAYASNSSLSVLAGDALKDPLVINFNGNAAQLQQTTFKFDLDADGKTDDMRFVAPGSGFLALDHNGDGKINDGRELFGTQSGNGFADLARYDDDSNGWIDEKDAMFSQLRVWVQDAAGKDQLLGLLQLGVGALYLGNTDTPFALKDSSNALQGAIRASGIYLREDGGMGTLQQIDIAV